MLRAEAGGQRSLLFLGGCLDRLKLCLLSLTDELDLPTLVELDVALAHHVVAERVGLLVLLGLSLLDGQFFLKFLEALFVPSRSFLSLELGFFISSNLGSGPLASEVRLHHIPTSARLG